ncbi:hypothetical protein P692DRAFT_201854809 [Suillus brevipes Sb2]|nr:hypothetical protein P692DRAFT_201854809 [Suillus brevipes Sb2]
MTGAIWSATTPLEMDETTRYTFYCKEESEKVSELKSISGSSKLPYGTLALGTEGIKDAISGFEDARKSDIENERLPPELFDAEEVAEFLEAVPLFDSILPLRCNFALLRGTLIGLHTVVELHICNRALIFSTTGSNSKISSNLTLANAKVRVETS